jgi:hypothetical protein
MIQRYALSFHTIILFDKDKYPMGIATSFVFYFFYATHAKNTLSKESKDNFAYRFWPNAPCT